MEAVFRDPSPIRLRVVVTWGDSVPVPTTSRGSNLVRTLPDPKGERDKASSSPPKAGCDKRTEVRLAIHASAHKLAWCLALPGPMPAAPAAMPRGADQRCMRFSIARAQAHADESALLLESERGEAHQVNINTRAMDEQGNSPRDLWVPEKDMTLPLE